MIRYLYASDLDRHPDLASDMFRDRSVQFHHRLGWDVTVDALGWETDGYDALDPLYVIATDGTGGHAGSMRFLPTTGPHMLEGAFPGLVDGQPVRSPRIWECTRFCLAPGAQAQVARRLMLAASELGLGMGLDHALGVFDRPMCRIYRQLGWAPEVVGREGDLCAGVWTFGHDRHDALLQACGIDAATSRGWFEEAFGDLPLPLPLPQEA